MKEEKSYFEGLFSGIKTLCIGLKTTMREFFTPKITEQYPENRGELKMFDRFRGKLTMVHTDKNEHHCVACGLCQMACPNGSITVHSEMITTDDGKKNVSWCSMNTIWVPACSASCAYALARTTPLRLSRNLKMPCSTAVNWCLR